MIPKGFKSSNKKLVGTTNDIKPLRVFCDGEQCISLWSDNFWKRVKFLFTNRLWLHIKSGQTQPPVYINVDYPFE